MQTVTLYGVNRANVAGVVGADTFVRGVEYARQHSVIQMRWDQSDQALDGMVRGSTGNFYDTTAYFSSVGSSALALSHGECSCPVGLNCKHVAALVLSAMGDAPAPDAPSQKPRPSTWERSLGSLLDSLRPIR